MQLLNSFETQESDLRITREHGQKSPVTSMVQVSKPGSDTCNGRVENKPGEGVVELQNPSPMLQGPTERLDQFKQDAADCSTFYVFRDMLVRLESSFDVCLAKEFLDSEG